MPIGRSDGASYVAVTDSLLVSLDELQGMVVAPADGVTVELFAAEVHTVDVVDPVTSWTTTPTCVPVMPIVPELPRTWLITSEQVRLDTMLTTP